MDVAKKTVSKRGSCVRVGDHRWLKSLLDGTIEMQACRYNVRQGSWNSDAVSEGQHFITFVEQGLLAVDVAGDELQLAGGELLWIQPGVPRIVRGSPLPGQVRHINIRFTVRQAGHYMARKGPYLHLPAAQGQRAAFDAMLEQREDGGRFPRLRLRQCLLGLCLDILNARRTPETGSSLHARQRYELQRFIAEHLHLPIGPQELAQHMQLSLDYFSRCFRRAYGIPPRQYLLSERMRVAAMELVDSRDSVQSIARRVGMDDANYFCRQFKKYSGMTPGAFRQRGLLPEQLQ